MKMTVKLKVPREMKELLMSKLLAKETMQQARIFEFICVCEF